MSKRILIVEDEEHLRTALKLNLELEGFNVVAKETGRQAIHECKESNFDLVVLDVMLPEIDGFTVCENIRIENKSVPILFLTAKGGSDDRVTGLKIGADDYMSKPFNLEEFILRVKNLLRRRSEPATPFETSPLYTFGENSINFLTYEIKGLNGETRTLTKKEVMLLQLLIERKNQVVSRDQILETVWGVDVYPSTRTIDNYILAFRKYFETNARQPKHFFSIRGVGYKFVP